MTFGLNIAMTAKTGIRLLFIAEYPVLGAVQAMAAGTGQILLLMQAAQPGHAFLAFMATQAGRILLFW